MHGKLRAIGSGTIRPTHYLLVSHEAQTTRMLDPHLEWLRARSPEIAAGLDYTFEFLGQHPAERGRALFLAGDLVAAADRMSAALDNHKGLDNLLAKTLPNRQRSTVEAVAARHRWRRPSSNATGSLHNSARRASHRPNSNAQEEGFPWL